MSKTLIIVPVREHSKGIRNKNIRSFVNGQTGLSMLKDEFEKLIDVDVLVSTESELLKSYAEYLGYTVFRRNRLLSLDKTTLDDVVASFIEEGGASQYEYFGVVQATSPLLSANSIQSVIDILNANRGIDTVFTASPLRKFSWKKDEDGTYKREYTRRSNRQWNNEDNVVVENGACTVSRMRSLEKTLNRFIGMDCMPFVLDDLEAVDIDSHHDISQVNTILERRRGKVAIVVKSGVSTGSGHVYRSLALAAELQPIESVFLCNACEVADDIYGQYEVPYIQIDSFRDVADFLSKQKIRAVVLDRLETTREEFKYLDSIDAPIVCVEDFGHAALTRSDLLVNALYETTIQFDKLRSGYAYEVIRPDVLAYASLPRNSRKEERDLRRVLICFGGTDPNGFRFRAFKAVAETAKLLGKEFSITVIGPVQAEEDEDVSFAFKSLHQSTDYVYHTSSIAHYISDADIVICGNGRMVYEATVLKKFVIAVPQNHREATHSFARDFPPHQLLSIHSEISDTEIANAIKRIVELDASERLFLYSLFSPVVKELVTASSRVAEEIKALKCRTS